VSTQTAGASLLRSRSARLVGAFFVTSLATGVLEIAIPLKLRQLQASPNEIGITLAMFGFGMFLFEWLWGIVADRVGYRIPLVVSQLLYGASIVLLARVDSVPLLAVSYLLASGMMVAEGPIGRSYVGTALPAALRATGLGLISASWVIGAAIGAGAGGWLLDQVAIRDVLYGAAVIPVLAGVLILWAFRGYSDKQRLSTRSADDDQAEVARGGTSVMRILMVTALLVLLIEIGAGGEQALLPLLVTSHLHLSAAIAGSAMLAAGLVGGVLLVPGGIASDRWGRKATMIAGGILSAVGFVLYAIAGGFGLVLVGVSIRAVGMSLIWPAAIAWVAESMPRRRHALMMSVFGEFENVGVTVGPILGGLAWSLAGIQAAFLTYAVAALVAAGIGAVMVRGRSSTSSPRPDLAQD
jgi:MFS family permease